MKAPRSPRFARLVPLLLAVLAYPAAGQDDARVQSDMDFARALASRFAYIDMAEKVMTELEAQGLTDSNKEGLGLLKCDVYAAGAKSEPSAEKRLGLYDKAIAAFEDYMEENPYSEFLPQARRNYVDLVNNYGRVLEITLGDLLGDEAETTRERIRTVLDNGLKLTGDLIDELSTTVNQVEKLEKWRLMLNRGQMLLTLANVSEDGTWYYGQAEQVLQDLALDAGETSGPGLNAYVLLSRVMFAQGDYLTATDYAGYVVEIVMPSEATARDQRWNNIPFEEKAVRWKLAELATATLVDSYMAAGKNETACAWALHFYNNWRVEGFTVSPLGYLSLLACASALLDSGGYVGGGLNQGKLRWFADEESMKAAGLSGTRNTRSSLDMSLSIAQAVNDANRGNTLQVRAQKVIADITSRPGVQVSPDILYEAAQGEYNAGDYAKALAAFKGILAQLDGRDEATKQEYAPKVLYHMGKSLGRMKRPLEAAMAFREGATTWAGDPEYQEKVAKGYYDNIRTAQRASGGDQTLVNMSREAEKIYADSLTNAGDAGTLIWRQAERVYGEKDYAGARTKFLEIQEGADDYEKARVKAAVCLYKMKDIEGAATEFRDYLEAYVPDPDKTLNETKKKTKRQEAMAMGTFYLGRIDYNAQQWDGVAKWLAGYDEAFPSQTEYAPNALYMLLIARLAQSDVEAAKAISARMTEKFATHKMTGTGASKIYNALKQERDALPAGDAGAAGLEAQMAEALHLSNELASEPKFDNVRAESKLWLELARWEEARAAPTRSSIRWSPRPRTTPASPSPTRCAAGAVRYPVGSRAIS